MSGNADYVTAQPVTTDQWDVNIFTYLEETKIEEAKYYSIDLLKILSILAAPASPEQFDFFSMEGVEGK